LKEFNLAAILRSFEKIVALIGRSHVQGRREMRV